jgi:hypothetical protein
MSNPKFKVIFTEADMNTADNAKQYYKQKYKEYNKISNVACYIYFISAIFLTISLSLIKICFKVETSEFLVNTMGLTFIILIIPWTIRLFFKRKMSMCKTLVEEHSKIVKVMDIILQDREYELKSSESGSIWINILVDSKVTDSMIIAQAQTERPLWLNVSEIEIKFTQTHNKKHEIICSWQVKPVKWY